MNDLAETLANRVADFPERIPLVPPTLADFECGHGYLTGCPDCDVPAYLPAVLEPDAVES